MRLRHIEVFHAVYSAGSITAAAKLLNVSQPSVSKVLAHAEQQLGFQLFKRVKGKIIPTKEAERLIEHVTDAYDNINELQRISENIRTSETGLIRIAMAPAFGIELVPAAIASYLSQYPETSFEIESLHYQQVARALKQSRVDIGMVFDPAPIPGIVIDHLASAECVAIAHKSMDFGIKQRLPLNDLEGKPYINLNTRSPLGRLLARRKQANNIRFNNVVKVETYQLAKALVAQGAGVSIIDEITARSSGHADVIFRKLQPPLEFNIALLHLEHEPLSMVTQNFVEHLRTAVKSFLNE